MTDPLPRRTLIRNEFAALAAGELVGAGRPVQDVFSYIKADFGGHSPVVMFGSGGSERIPFTGAGSRKDYLIDCLVYVLYADIAVDLEGNVSIRRTAQGDAVWTEEHSEAALDLVEELVTALVDAHPRGANWKGVEYGALTEPGWEIVGEQLYRKERIPLRFHWF